MRKAILTVLWILLCINVQSVNAQSTEILHIINERLSIPQESECDSIIEHNGYLIHVVKDKCKIKHIGLNLFSDEMKTSFDEDILNFIEEALLAKALKINGNQYEKLVITNGNIYDFKKLSPESKCTVNIHNSQLLISEWTVAGKAVSIKVPIGYDTAVKGSRSDIENEFISRLKSSVANRLDFEIYDKDKLEPYGKDKLIYPGNTYKSKDISRNTYFNIADLKPLWDVDYPLESMSNLFICPSEGYDNIRINLTILKHEYGEKDIVSIFLNQLLSVCESDGCIPYWGVEKFENGILHGALFLYNQKKGYNHVIKIECIPDEIINNNGEIKARASLFIPTNNVDNLYSPYFKKNDKERIKYER